LSCGFKVRILQHHKRRVATQLQMQSPEKRCRRPGYLPSRSHPSGKRDDWHIRVEDEFASNVAATGEHMQQIVW
jgi:hypothetical protein